VHRAVLDTNVLVSALIQPRGVPGRIVARWLDGQFDLILSPVLLEELGETLADRRVRKYLRLEAAAVQAALSAFATLAILVPGSLSVPRTVRDADDDRVLAAAVEGNVGYIVSGDSDLLVLEQYEEIRIVTPRQFLSVLPPVRVPRRP
jgi:putative PIN family toxin of toxin-antitoxin system